MDPLSLSSVSEQARENNVNNKFLLPRKPARQPNPIIYRKLRRGSAAGRFPEKQIEYPTNKELLRTIVYLRNATAVYYEPDKILPYNKAYIDEEDEEEWSTQSEEEKGQKELKKTINNSNDILTKKRKKKSSHIDKENKEPSISSSSSHVINIKEMRKTLERRGQGLTKNDSEHRAALAVKLYGVQAALLSALGNPFENLSQSISSRNSSQILSLSKASTGFLPAILWTGMFIVSFVYTLIVVWSLAFRVPIISMLCLSLLYCLSVLVAAASGFDVMCGTFRMSGILFASLGVLGFVMLLLVVVLLVLFASWRCPKQDGGAK
ncbi:hypothetical protein D0Y65_049296 [Glycine soja]|uniref:Transmembrane protein n=1 Tax=Glycine soja TaxID=3848 RepID=A0A445FWF1_GLYSO|nr:hypothetical protein D0Y65_049296 [Glycine soja]